MCTFNSEKEVMVCDTAISQVKAAAGTQFGDQISYTVVDGEGTLVKAPTQVDGAEFGRVVRQAIATANATS